MGMHFTTITGVTVNEFYANQRAELARVSCLAIRRLTGKNPALLVRITNFRDYSAWLPLPVEPRSTLDFRVVSKLAELRDCQSLDEDPDFNRTEGWYSELTTED